MPLSSLIQRILLLISPDGISPMNTGIPKYQFPTIIEPQDISSLMAFSSLVRKEERSGSLVQIIKAASQATSTDFFLGHKNQASLLAG